MQLYQLLAIQSCVLVLAVGCVHNHAAIEPETKCTSGQLCKMSGTLGLFKGVPANAAMLTFRKGAGCIALALDSETFERAQSLDGKEVTVWGVPYSPPDMPELLWYEFRGRKVSRGICDGPQAIYVDRISDGSG
jgi:hypothetical protein